MQSANIRERVLFVLRNGQRIVLLDEPEVDDMFWYSFRTHGLSPVCSREDFASLWNRELEVEDPRLGVKYGGVIAASPFPSIMGDRVRLRGVAFGSIVQERTSKGLPRWADRLLVVFTALLCVRAVNKARQLNFIALPLNSENPTSWLWGLWLLGAMLCVCTCVALFKGWRYRYLLLTLALALAPLRYAIGESEWGTP